MVLKDVIFFTILFFALLAFSCTKKVVKPDFLSQKNVKLAVIVDSENGCNNAPDSALEILKKQLNYGPSLSYFGSDTIEKICSKPKQTEIRLSSLIELGKSNKGSKTLAILELKPKFFSRIAGKFRHVVHYKLTIANPNKQTEVDSKSSSVKVFLERELQGEKEVLQRAMQKLPSPLNKSFKRFFERNP